MSTTEKTREEQAVGLTISNLIINFSLALLKILAGVFANSAAMVSDGVHTLSDGFSSILVIIGIKAGAKKADHNHQYGHERFESVSAILLSIILAVTGALIAWSAISYLINGSSIPYTPGVLAIIAAIVSIFVKEAMYWRTRHLAKKLKSSALMADAWHNRSDALSSIGALIAILGARMGFPILDPLASVVISAFILKAAIDIFLDAVGKMTDRAAPKELMEEVSKLVLAQGEVLAIDLLQSRVFGDRVYIDIEIALCGNSSLFHAHEVAQQVHNAIEHEFPDVKHCMVHMNPRNCVENTETQ